jgi:WD domain, G-beta repeat
MFVVGTCNRRFKDIHENHINISRFSNTSPFLFATSSFDKTVKMWDARISLTSNCCPIYSCSSKQGHVMLCFSPDDVFLLTSAVDNEVSQYHAVDGRLHFRLDAPTPPNTASQQENFTRRYALYTSYECHMMLFVCNRECVLYQRCPSMRVYQQQYRKPHIRQQQRCTYDMRAVFAHMICM